MKRIEVAAYAKVNFILDMTGLREDGYHQVESIMQAIELHDDVAVEWDEGPSGGPFQIELDPGSPKLPSDGQNLACKAALAMQQHFCPQTGGMLRISVKKRIPIVAGLAGGSSNGAAVCTALGKLWGIPMEDWLPVAASLGADVPFSAWAQNGRPAAFATGTGTELTAIEPLDCRLVLRNPGYPVSTKEVYQAFDKSPKGMSLAADPHSEGRCAQWIQAGTLAEKLACMNNDLQPVTLALRPKLQRVFDVLHALQPAPLAVQLSGSGPTVYAVYPPDGPLPDEMSVLQTLV